MTARSKTIRLLMPQWQGGNQSAYFLGAQMLEWLAPRSSHPTLTVPVPAPDGAPLVVERGIAARSQIVRQASDARQLIDSHMPDRIAVFGGDCLVDLAPFAYLSERHGEHFGILWIDAHPDVTTPEHYANAHAMVLGSLMGTGDPELAAFAKRAVPGTHVMYAGLGKTMPHETAFIAQHGIASASAEDLEHSSEKVIAWIKARGIEQLAIHFDLDVLDKTLFRSLYFTNPNEAPSAFDGITQGTMRMQDVIRLISDVSHATEIVGIGIAEHLPWDAVQLRDMLAELPVLKD